MAKTIWQPRCLPVALSLTVCLLGTTLAMAQSDDFNSGSLDAAWKRSQFNPALVNLSFPEGPTGKALRIQASPVPDAAPAAAMLYREQVYTNFYMALDVVDWPGTDKNQAIVLVARASLTGNPAETTGIIMNYDASQYGENATDRRQGQFQINMVTNDPPFATKTIAVAEITLQPGRPYRLIFQGVGSHYTGRVYDLFDLTRPLVTIEADDDTQGPLPGGGSVTFESGFKSGVCGLLSFSRQGTAGTTDITIDNYYAGPSDPNPAAVPALAHPIAGTSTVESRTPANRFANFHPPGDGLSFTAKTYSTDLINAAATKLYLNGVDFSSQLVVPTNAPAITVSLPGSALRSDTPYLAQIEVEDVSGTKKSTNTFSFDTFSEAFLSGAGVRTIEAEEYNFNNGEFLPEPIPVSGVDTNGAPINQGVGYSERTGVEDVDFHDARTAPEATWALEYRSNDPVGLSAGIYPEVSDLNEPEDPPTRRSDHVRLKYASSNLLEYVVHRTEPGEWLNYTRNFAAGSYTAYLRVASFGATDVELHRVTSDPKQPAQTTARLGTFHVPNLLMRANYSYVPLVNEQGIPASIELSGEQTLRLVMAGTPGQDARKIALNYILLTRPEPLATLRLLSSATVNGSYLEEPGATIDSATGTVTVARSGETRFYLITGGTSQRIASVRVSGNTVTLTYQQP
ncbi:MAG: hypothetical protein U1G07_01955 [Verrucomicrobiota bacterium]